ncbi:MAG TPA: hypothetical protein VGF07_01045 [Stellaceae bacterium]
MLASAAHNTLILQNSNFTGVTGSTITVYGGGNGNTISEAGVSGADRTVMKGGAEADTLVAGRNAVMTGGAGNDLFVFTAPGSVASPDKNRIADFIHGADKIAFRTFGFGSKPDAAILFGANATGSFTTSAQRLAYRTTTGALYYDAHGNAPGSAHQLVAILTGHPTLSAADITFVS